MTRARADSSEDDVYLIVWWMSHSPFAAVFRNRVTAEAAARVRNSLLITLSGKDLHVEAVDDWYRRDEEGNPMPAEWRDLGGQLHVPWTRKAAELAEAAA